MHTDQHERSTPCTRYQPGPSPESDATESRGELKAAPNPRPCACESEADVISVTVVTGGVRVSLSRWLGEMVGSRSDVEGTPAAEASGDIARVREVADDLAGSIERLLHKVRSQP